jgi:hypothetical protein
MQSQLLGTRFAEALAAKDFDRLMTLLHPEIDFQGLTPGRHWIAQDPREVVEEVLKSWFEEEDHIEELISCETSRVVDRNRVTYRVMVRNGDGRSVVEQQMYYDVKDGLISYARCMCSGFRSIASENDLAR